MSAGAARVIASRNGAAAAQTALQIRDVSLVFNTAAGKRPILDRISFDVFDGEILCLVGPSGCGKTTILRLLAGLLRPTSGEVLFEKTPVAAPSRERAIVFQDYTNALLPWRTVAGNVALSLEARQVPRDQHAGIVSELLQKMGLQHAANQYPNQSFRAACSNACRLPAVLVSSRKSF